MKRITAVIVLALFFALQVQAGGKIQTVTIRTRINCDHCKMCGSCGKRLETALYNMKGIRCVDIDDKTMNISVAYHTEKTSPEAIRNIIANSGYDADNVKASAEAVAQLDDCCKGETE